MVLPHCMLIVPPPPPQHCLPYDAACILHHVMHSVCCNTRRCLEHGELAELAERWHLPRQIVTLRPTRWQADCSWRPTPGGRFEIDCRETGLGERNRHSWTEDVCA
ncbi:hypothetical protein KIL84_010274 [Mauremys mutica]|uniref:Uncharacterized protein n=1 Tax=Mauremys mutica TaxID=74926 RepID=A0A9D4B6S7_9SAUR|nr:hypothetical protein KIL84_010274 [Mauremys mutica]